jgi:hypothetical protein
VALAPPGNMCAGQFPTVASPSLIEPAAGGSCTAAYLQGPSSGMSACWSPLPTGPARTSRVGCPSTTPSRIMYLTCPLARQVCGCLGSLWASVTGDRFPTSVAVLLADDHLLAPGAGRRGPLGWAAPPLRGGALKHTTAATTATAHPWPLSLRAWSPGSGSSWPEMPPLSPSTGPASPPSGPILFGSRCPHLLRRPSCPAGAFGTSSAPGPRPLRGPSST